MLFGAEKRSVGNKDGLDNGSQILQWMAVAGDGAFPEGCWEEWIPVTSGERIS